MLTNIAQLFCLAVIDLYTFLAIMKEANGITRIIKEDIIRYNTVSIRVAILSILKFRILAYYSKAFAA